MATIVLDGSYIFGRRPTGIATYSRRLIESLAQIGSKHRFLIGYRISRFTRRREFLCPHGTTARFLTFWLPWQADLFHSLAQRPPVFRFQREVVTVHDVFPISGPDYSPPEFQRKFSALLREAVARAHRIVTDSLYTAEQLQRHCGVSGDKVRVVPPGVDVPSTFLPAEIRMKERARQVGAGNEMLLAVGNVENRKNLVNLLRALKLLPERYRLVLAGGDGYGSEAVRAFIAGERLESRVRLLGYVSSELLGILYESASALVFPSLEEGFGFPVLEAMAHRLPVVTSSTSSIPEVGGDAALYVNPGDPREIAEQVVKAVESEPVRRGLIEQGNARARQFSWTRTAQRMIEVYDEVLSG